MSRDPITDAFVAEELIGFAVEEALGVSAHAPLTAAADLWRAGIYLPPIYEIEE